MCVETQEKESLIENKESYKIYDYMEKHHSLLIACVSAFVAIGSLATSVLAYVYQCLKLQAWNVPMEFLSEIKQSKYFYAALIGMLYYCFIPIYQMYLQNIFKEQFIFFDLVNLEKKLMKKLCIYQKKKGKTMDINEQVLILKKCLNVIKGDILKKVVFMVFGASFLWGILFILFEVSIGGIGIYSFICGGTVLLFMFGTTLFFFRKSNKINEIEKLNNKAQNVEDNLQIVELIEEINDLCKKLINSSGKNKKIKGLFSDRNLSILVSVIVGGFIEFCVCFMTIGFITGKVQTGFWLYQDGRGQYYAVVYQNENEVILEKAFIEDNKISINVNTQLFKTYQDSQFEYVEFEHVEKVKETKIYNLRANMYYIFKDIFDNTNIILNP